MQYVIQVNNWARHVGNSQRETYFFKFSWGFFAQPEIHRLIPEEKLLFIYLCCMQCRSQGKQFSLDAQTISSFTGLNFKKIHAYIYNIYIYKLINILNINTVEEEKEPERTRKEQEIEQDVSQKKDKVKPLLRSGVRQFDFEGIYRNYPRKAGKSAGMKICAREIRTQEDFDSLARAVAKYREITQHDETEYIKYFSTFMGCWRDYLDPDVGTCSVPGRRTIEDMIREEEAKLLGQGDLLEANDTRNR